VDLVFIVDNKHSLYTIKRKTKWRRETMD
jgi:hypothetical protein